ncbi:17364_t:CDS:2, partial [Racocetra persica]
PSDEIILLQDLSITNQKQLDYKQMNNQLYLAELNDRKLRSKVCLHTANNDQIPRSEELSDKSESKATINMEELDSDSSSDSSSSEDLSKNSDPSELEDSDKKKEKEPNLLIKEPLEDLKIKMLNRNRKIYIHNPYEVPNYDAVDLNKKQYNLFKKQCEINQDQKYLIEITCNGTWQGIQEAITCTGRSKSYRDLKLVLKKEQKKQIKDNLEAILSQTKNTDVMVLLENLAANKCHGVQIEDLLKIKRTTHPKIKAMILETLGRTEKQKQEQIREVYRVSKIEELGKEEEQERYQDPRKQEAIERMRRKQIEQILFKTNEILLKGYVSQFSSNIKKLEKLQEQTEDENIAKTLTDLIDHIATMDSNFQKFKGMKDVSNTRPEQYINLTEAQRRATQAKLTAIDNTSLNEEERKRANKR